MDIWEWQERWQLKHLSNFGKRVNANLRNVSYKTNTLSHENWFTEICLAYVLYHCYSGLWIIQATQSVPEINCTWGSMIFILFQEMNVRITCGQSFDSSVEQACVLCNKQHNQCVFVLYWQLDMNSAGITWFKCDFIIYVLMCLCLTQIWNYSAMWIWMRRGT